MKVASLAGLLLVPVVLASSPAQGKCKWGGCFLPGPISPVPSPPLPPKVEDKIKKRLDHVTTQAAQAMADQAKTNIRQSLELAKALTKGDVDKIRDSAGKLIVEGECIGCKQAITSVLGEDSLPAVEAMVGTGFVVLLDVATAKQGGALFMTHDAVAKKTIIMKLNPLGKRVEEGPIPTTQAEADKKPDTKAAAGSPRTFLPTDKATCIIAPTSDDSPKKSSKKSNTSKSDQQRLAFIGFSDFPPLKEEASGTVKSVNGWTLRDGDKIIVEAPLCAGQSSAKNKQQSLTKITIIYVKDYTVLRAGQATNYVMAGRLAI